MKRGQRIFLLSLTLILLLVSTVSASYMNFIADVTFNDAKVTGDLNASTICLNGDCRVSWPIFTSPIPAGCTEGQVIIYNSSSSSWVCSDATLDVSGEPINCRLEIESESSSDHANAWGKSETQVVNSTGEWSDWLGDYSNSAGIDDQGFRFRYKLNCTGTVFGSSVDLPSCSSNQILKFDGSNWVCEDLSAAAGCEWKSMITTTTKPGGSSCGTGNMIAYITPTNVSQNAPSGICRYTTNAGYGDTVYGYLVTRGSDNSEYGTDRVLVCQNDWYTATLTNDNSCGVDENGIAEYLVCDGTGSGTAASFDFGTPEEKTLSTVYEATTSGFVEVTIGPSYNNVVASAVGYKGDSASTLEISKIESVTAVANQDYPTAYGSFNMLIKKGEFYKVELQHDSPSYTTSEPEINITWTPISSSGSSASLDAPLEFEVYNSDTTTYACVNQDLEEYCGDADGCTIKLLLQHETDGNDQVHVIEETIFMEQSDMSNNNGAGLYGWTRQQGGGDFSWITGSTGQYTIFNPWDWTWAFNYKHDWCDGQVGNSPAYSNPYEFTFMSHPSVRTKVMVYDSPNGAVSSGSSAGIPSCSNDQIIKYNSTSSAWECSTNDLTSLESRIAALESSVPSNPIVAGGHVYDEGDQSYVCQAWGGATCSSNRFGSCPAGTTKFHSPMSNNEELVVCVKN